MNTHRLGDGFYLARTTDATLQARIAELVAGRTMQRRMLGVALAPASVAAEMRRAVGLPDRAGLLVRGLADGGPAAAAGLRIGDLLVRAGTTELTAVEALQAALDAAGETLELGIVRGLDEVTIVVTLDPPAAPPV